MTDESTIFIRAKAICKKCGIDPCKVCEIKDIHTPMKGEDVLYGTVIKHHTDDGRMGITINLLGGWVKTYTSNESKPDTVRIIRDLRAKSFTQKQIAEILSLSQSQVSLYERSKNIGNKGGE